MLEADIVIADLTDLNPNVLYELGVAHSFDKKTIVLTRNPISDLPFDLSPYKARNYTTQFKDFDTLIDYLKMNISGALDGSILFSNPVTDCIAKKQIDIKNCVSDKTSEAINIASEKGFLDFLADIEEESNGLTAIIRSIATDLNEMNIGVNESTSKINAAKKSGNSSTSFIRFQAKTVAGYIDRFSKKLRSDNIEIANKWNNIEKNTVGLLDNKYSFQEGNRENIIKYLNSLRNLQSSVISSNGSVTDMRDNVNVLVGFEGNLTQAARFLIRDLNDYLSATSQIVASIDQILEKKRFVFGDLDQPVD